MNPKRLEETHDTEVGLREAVIPDLGRWFQVHEEVRGTHYNGRRLRIDAIVTPLDSSGWKDEDPAFGVEFKMPPESFDTRNFTRWAAQAVDYVHVNWDGFGYLRIFTCPSPVARLTPYGTNASRLMMRMLGQLGVGELVRLQDRGWALLLNEHRLWSEAEGVQAAGRWSIRPKEGSR